MNTLTRLENWKAAERCRSVRIDIDDGYGATCWECELRRRKNWVRCVESTGGGERIEKDGNLFIRCPATDGDWSGLEAVINCAIDAAKEFWKGLT
ncbi:MAG TPA: hypothetical protein VLA12_19145 [Planctomycetaceae bacterium]|nr:hypothetical protein [Planctomycetaceae bacterium]